VLGDDRHERAGPPLGLDDLVNLLDGDLGGLLDDDVFARVEGFDGHRAVQAGRRCDRDDVDVLVCQRLGQ
jgi:hypothetical protein